MVPDYVEDDKPTLAKCMRSSLQLNLLAAPRLYSKLRWGSNLSCPIDIPSTITTSSITRVSPTKRENLELIRTFYLDNHVLGDCSTFRSRAARPEDIVPIAVLHHGTGEERPIKLIHIHTPLNSHCSFLSRLAPRRLVVTVTHLNGMLPIGSIEQRLLSKVIVYTNLKNGQLLYGDAPQPPHMRPFHKSSATNKTLVYIITEMNTDANPGLGKPMLSFCAHLANVIYRPEFAQNILFVDATGRNRHPNVSKAYCCEKNIARLERRIRRIFKKELEVVKFRWRTEGDNCDYKDIAEAQATTIKFMNSREYLDNYDTEGEFTDEERARLMVTDM